MRDLSELAAAGREAVLMASAVCRRVQAGLRDAHSVTKDDRSPVTIADFASQAVVAWSLREALGSFTLVAEEDSAMLRSDEGAPLLGLTLEAAQHGLPQLTAETMLGAIDLAEDEDVPAPREGFWTLDPIDGTKGFLRGQQYCVSLAYIVDGEPVVGVLGCPNLPLDPAADLMVPDSDGSLYVAVKGEGVREAACVPESGAVAMAKRDAPHAGEIRVCESVEKSHSKHDDTARILEHLGGEVGKPARLDSQCKYAVVARGQADAYLRPPTRKGYVERIWDHAGGSLVARETGRIVTDITGAPLDFGRGRGLEANRGIICAAQGLHGRVIDAIAALGIGAD